jgi:hypothetical protein
MYNKWTRADYPGLVDIDIQIAKATMVTIFRWWRTSIEEDKDRQCTYNVTLGRLRVTVVAVEWQLVLRIFSACIIALVIRHANRRFSAPYYVVMWPVWPKHIFPHCLTNDTTFGGKKLFIKHVFWFFLQLSFVTFLLLRNIQRVIIINVQTSSWKVPAILVRL